MKQVWLDIKHWMEENASHLINYLAPAATIDDIEDVENKLNVKFSNGFKEFYMIHDGQINESESLIDMHVILSLKRIISEWQVWTDLLNEDAFVYDGESATSDPDPGIKNDWWNIKWIPITSNHRGDNFCIDINPHTGGKMGQIISMWHDAGWRELRSKSFEDCIIQYSNDLKEGKYYYEKQSGIWRKQNY